MKLIEFNNRLDFDRFINTEPKSQFLQSWQWGEFQKVCGYKIWRLGIEEDGEIVAAATLLGKAVLVGRSYFFCPRGPVVQLRITNLELRIKVFDFLFKEIEKIAKCENAIFLRFEPQFQVSSFRFQVSKTIDIQPAKTLILDLSKSEEEILADMHQKTRYNIRLAEKKGVIVREATINEFDNFWKLAEQTGERDGFRLHSRGYYLSMLKNNPDFIKLFFAELDEEILTANIVSFFGDTVTYVHGASNNKFREVMAPYALQWYSIKLAKKLRFKYYDFFGIDEKKWPGVTRFKKGFGGEEVDYPGTFDAVFNKRWYNGYKLLRWIRRKV